MPFKISCPFCNQHVEVPDELNDTSAACPACGQEIYLSREDALEDVDPVVASMRRESAAADRAHMEELRRVAMMQEQARLADASAKRFINVFLWIFLWGPLCAVGGYFLFMVLFRIATGRW